MDPLDLDGARKRFLTMLIRRAYFGTIKGITEQLEEGSSKHHKSLPHLEALRYWFHGLDEENREYVRMMIEESVYRTLFGSLVLLDGLTGGYPIPEKISDFALYLQTYPDLKSQSADTPDWHVRLNNSTEDLHDLYRDVLAELLKSESE